MVVRHRSGSLGHHGGGVRSYFDKSDFYRQQAASTQQASKQASKAVATHFQYI